MAADESRGKRLLLRTFFPSYDKIALRRKYECYKDANKHKDNKDANFIVVPLKKNIVQRSIW